MRKSLHLAATVATLLALPASAGPVADSVAHAAVPLTGLP